MRRFYKLPIAAALAAALCAPGVARELEPGDTPEVVGALFACSSVADAAARLACYDKASAALAQAQQAKDIVFVDRDQMREARKGMFGFSFPKIRLFGGGDDEDDQAVIKELSSSIDRTGQMPTGQWFFVLPDGARWNQTDTQVMIRDPKKGDTIVIKRGPVGNYLASIAGRRGIRVKRVD
jgi:hypothetical protein